MTATAKVFTTGNSQAIRLPKAFRVDVQEMWIVKNDITGEITLKPKASADQRKQRLDKLFQMVASNPLPEDFLAPSHRHNPAALPPDVFPPDVFPPDAPTP